MLGLHTYTQPTLRVQKRKESKPGDESHGSSRSRKDTLLLLLQRRAALPCPGMLRWQLVLWEGER